MVTLEEFYNSLALEIRKYANKGYSKEKKATRNSVARSVLCFAKKRFPEIADHLEVRYTEGLGYFNGYSDFFITYKGWDVLAASTHDDGTIAKSVYRAELYNRYLGIICNKAGVHNPCEIMNTYTLDDFVNECKKIQREDKCASYKLKIKEKETELTELKKQLALIDFESFIDILKRSGNLAIEDFLGYGISSDIDEDVIKEVENALWDAYEEMSEEKYQMFVEKYVTALPELERMRSW